MIVIREEFKKLIPALTAEEFKQLEANILSEGIRDPLVLWKGYLVDGHNRYAIASEHGLDYKTVNKDFKDSNEVKEWMILNQFGRRNLSNYQRSVLALQLEEVFSSKAKENQIRKPESVVQKSEQQKPMERKAITQIAKVANVSHDTIAKVKKIEAVATPEVKAQLSTGELSINQAYQEIKKEENKEQRLIKESIEYKPKNMYIPKIINGDCLDVLKTIPDIDLLLTDPPYFTDGDFTNHISQCLQKVKPTGQAYVFAGADPKEMQAYLSLNSHHMELVQVLVWNYNNTGQRQPNERYTSNFQVCFYFRGKQAPLINKPADGKNQYACQTINAPDGRIGDRYHKWQKPNQLIENLILNSSNVGDFVFDPFAGSGTTLVVAAKNDRVAIGCDIDQEAINLCIKRGCSDEL
jgi:DNA modification methylase